MARDRLNGKGLITSLRHTRRMSRDYAPSITRDGAEIRLEWPGLVVLAFGRAGEIEIGQFVSEDPVTRAKVETRVRLALIRA